MSEADPSTRVMTTCSVCGTDFGHPRRKRRVNCSRRCAAIARGRLFAGRKKQTPVHLDCTCETCGTPFRYRPWGGRVAKYCSRRCFAKAHAASMLTRRERRHSEQIRTVSFRIRMTSVLINECAICGWKESSCDVAHILARKNGGRNILANVLMLCPNHHRIFDDGLIPLDVIFEAKLRTDQQSAERNAPRWQALLAACG